MSNVALVTGTSSGIGLSAAVGLAKAGFLVVATMRDLAKAEPLKAHASAAGVTLEVRQLDVQDQASIDAGVQDILATYGRIDLLVNNAGVGFLGSVEQTPAAEAARIMDVNYFGVWRMTQAVIPTMRAQHAGRIITVTSIGGLLGQPFNEAYCAAKFAVEGLMESFAPPAKRLGIQVSLIEPGPVNTAFVANTHRPPLESVPEPYRALLADYIRQGERAYRVLGQTSDNVARVIVRVATRKAPALRYTTSPLARLIVSALLASKLWSAR